MNWVNIEGENLVVEYRTAGGELERLPRIADESRKEDLVIAPNTPAALAVRQATRTVPIVAQAMGDPVADGLVASLARPGGNVGLTFLGPKLVPKRIELLKEALPGAPTIAILWHPDAYG